MPLNYTGFILLVIDNFILLKPANEIEMPYSSKWAIGVRIKPIINTSEK